MSPSTPSQVRPNSISGQSNAFHKSSKVNSQARHVGISTVTVLNAHHLRQHSVTLEAARCVAVHALRDHAEFHGHTLVAPSLLDVVLLLGTAEGKVRRLARVRDALVQGLVVPPWRKESGNGLGLANEGAEGFLGRWLKVVDRADHGVAIEVVLVFLTQTQEVDEELEGLLLGAVVEECVFADGCEWLGVLLRRGRRFHVGLSAGLRVAFSLLAALLVGLPVCLLAVFVAVTGRLAASTVEERDVSRIACSAGSSFGHCRLDRSSVRVDALCGFPDLLSA